MATDVSAPLPAVELLPLSTLTVTVDDAAAKITALNVHGYQDDTPAGLVVPDGPVMFLPG